MDGSSGQRSAVSSQQSAISYQLLAVSIKFKKTEKPMRNFKTLLVWQKSHELVLEIYNITQDFPNEERFCLTSQIRRASTSIALNIAEGCGRKTEKEFANFLNISFGSCSEVEYALLLCKDLNIIKEERYNELDNKLSEIKKMISALIKKLTN